MLSVHLGYNGGNSLPQDPNLNTILDKKLLIIEDSKSIAKIHFNIAKRLGLEPTVAYSYAETVEALNQSKDFFCAVIDYNLPDASNGEAIDYVIQMGIPVIVMTGMTNKAVRDWILKRPIIDYVPKDNKQDYVYLQQLLGQLLRNGDIKVLVVDDSRISRKMLCNQLQRQNYKVFEAVDGVHALTMLEQHSDIKLVLTDQEMPNMDGVTLTQQIRKTWGKEKLVIIGISGSKDNSLTARFIKSGANDYLHKPFCVEEFNCRLMHNIQYLENIETIRDQNSKMRQRNKDIAVLSEIGREITSSLDIDLIYTKVYNHVNSLMDAYIFGIGLYRPDEGYIEFSQLIEGGVKLPPYQIDINEPNRLSAWCVSNCKEIVIKNKGQEADYVEQVIAPITSVRAESMIYQPLLVQDHLIGCLTVQSMKPDMYSDYHVDMIRTIAASTAIALDNAENHRKLKENQDQMVMQEKMASLGTLTAGVAHEINNPTNFAHVSAQNLEFDLNRFKSFLFELAGDDAETEILESFNEQFEPLFKHLSTIKDGTDRIKGIVKDLQAFTRHDKAGTQKIHIADSLSSTIKLVQAQYKESTEFIENYPFNPQIECWPAQLNQVYMNLLVNACHAIDKRKQNGEPELKGMVEVSTSQKDEHLIIAFKDNGCGMEPATRSKLFEPFFTTKEVGKGTGLGLSISFGIIQKHDGDIVVESQPGVGSTFIIRLPCAV